MASLLSRKFFCCGYRALLWRFYLTSSTRGARPALGQVFRLRGQRTGYGDRWIALTQLTRACCYDGATVEDYKVWRRGSSDLVSPGFRSMRPKPRGRLRSLESMGRPASSAKRDPPAVSFVSSFASSFSVTCYRISLP